MLGRAALTTIVLVLAGGRLLAQVPREERVPVRDPARLEALGFPRDASNVYVWSKAQRREVEAVSAAPAPEAPDTWGTAAGYSNVFGYELENQINSFLDRNLLQTNCDLHWTDTGTEAVSYVRFPVPGGAALKQFKIWGYDSSDPLDLDFQLFEHCQDDGAGGGSSTLIGELFTILAMGDYFAFTPLGDLTADDRRCGYSVRVHFAAATEDCPGGQLQVRKMQLVWARQVSPAPAAATFADVPASHPFFQFVEALAKSGVTGGCGSGNYCPDAPLTRGQMAVFLSKALGLQWP